MMDIIISNYRPDTVPSGVRRAVREFDPTLDIFANKSWSSETDKDLNHRYMIAQRVNRAIETTNDDIIAIVKDWFPVLFVPKAMEIEQRWFHELHANKIQKVAEMREKLYEEQFKSQDKLLNEMKDWARDEGYWYFKKQYGDFYFPSVKPRDPTWKQKELEDRLGRRPR